MNVPAIGLPRRCLAALALLLAALGPLAAADFPVTNAAQITTAMASALPGDTLTMTNGVWTNENILFKGNGTAAQPITLRAQTPGWVVLNGISQLNIAGRYLTVDGLWFKDGILSNSDVVEFRQSSSTVATNCRLSNCAITGYNPQAPGTDIKWVSLHGVSNRVDRCFFKNKTNDGTTLVIWVDTNRPNDHVVDHDYFGQRPALGVNGGETIRVGTSDVSMSDSRTVVESNYFERCSGELEIISNKSGRNVYRYNTFVECEGTLTMRHGNFATVEGNFFLGHSKPSTGGVRVIAEDHKIINNYFANLTGTDSRAALSMVMGITNSPLSGYFQVQRAQVLFNTFVDCNDTFIIGLAGSTNGLPAGTLAPIDCTIANNLVRGTSAPLVDQRATPTNFLWEGDLMYGATVGITTNGITVANPLLVLAADGLWRPVTNSPALGAAAGSYPAVADDFEGQPRPGSGKDIGCDQASTSFAPRRPLTPSDVGPEWMRVAGPVLSGEFVGNNFVTTWPSVPGLTYQVQYGANLQSWIDISPTIVSATNTFTWTDDGSKTGGSPGPQTRRFYRLKIIP